MSTETVAAPASGVVDKGLKRDAVGLLGSVALALCSVAPAYALTATLGPTVSVGGAQMPATFLVGLIDTTDPVYGSGGSIFGLGTVFVLGVGVLLLGAVFMFFWQAREPAFFRGGVLKRDTPPLVVDD